VAAGHRPEHIRQCQQHQAERQRGRYHARRDAATVELEAEVQGGHANPEEDQQPGTEQLSRKSAQHEH
jgi:hypothetical protein